MNGSFVEATALTTCPIRPHAGVGRTVMNAPGSKG